MIIFIVGSTLKHRQVQHFGYEFKYGSNSINLENPLERKIPESASHICQRLVDQEFIQYFPDQLTVNKYEPSQGKNSNFLV